MTRPLNVGMIDYGFMARVHANAWRQVARFFRELAHRPTLKVVAARSEDTYADRWLIPEFSKGYEHTFIHALADFLKGVESGTPAEPTFRTALQTRRVCDALPRSAKQGQRLDTRVAA